ncbi:MAG: hypothetical protein WDO19_03065 [Bacteroidota bacterium]
MWSQEIYFSPHFLQDITVPIMLVIGDRDNVTAEHGIEMHRMIRNSQFCILTQYLAQCVFRKAATH